MADVVQFPGVTFADLPPDQILQSAMGKLDSAVILGYDKDGNEYFAFSTGDGTAVLWLLERLKMMLLQDSSNG